MHNIKKLLSSPLQNDDDFVLILTQTDSSNSSNNKLSWMHINYSFSRRKICFKLLVVQLGIHQNMYRYTKSSQMSDLNNLL